MKTIVLIMTLFYSLTHAQDLIEYDYEVDMYYSNVSMFIDLDTATNLTQTNELSEADIYSSLLLKTLQPNIFLVEASVHPMALAGMYVRHEHPQQYEESKLDTFNWLKAITSGFDEPYSLSFFMGRMMVFKKKDEDYIGKNRAYIGYLLTIGDHTIKDNFAHKDNWAQVEFKLKGTREKLHIDLDWSFRVGGRFHENHNFVDTIYFGARRSNTSYNKDEWSFISNSAFTTMVAFDSKHFQLTEAEFVLEKKWPLGEDKLTFGLGLGYLYSNDRKYTGELQENGIDNHQVLIRPNISW